MGILEAGSLGEWLELHNITLEPSGLSPGAIIGGRESRQTQVPPSSCLCCASTGRKEAIGTHESLILQSSEVRVGEIALWVSHLLYMDENCLDLQSLCNYQLGMWSVCNLGAPKTERGDTLSRWLAGLPASASSRFNSETLPQWIKRLKVIHGLPWYTCTYVFPHSHVPIYIYMDKLVCMLCTLHIQKIMWTK